MSAPYLIFGSTGFIGRSLAKNLVSQGFPVFLSGRNKIELDDLTKELKCQGEIADVLNEDQIKNVINLASKNGGLAGLAYCVGSIVLKPLKMAKNEDFLNTFNLNVMGAVQALKYSEPHLKSNKGSVVLFSSIASGYGFANHSVISTSKGAIEGLTHALAAEWAPHVRVNAIAPSLTESKMAEPLLKNQAQKEKIAKGHPMQRVGIPTDVSNLASFLLNPQNSWITGQIIHVDGGKSRIQM